MFVATIRKSSYQYSSTLKPYPLRRVPEDVSPLPSVRVSFHRYMKYFSAGACGAGMLQRGRVAGISQHGHKLNGFCGDRVDIDGGMAGIDIRGPGFGHQPTVTCLCTAAFMGLCRWKGIDWLDFFFDFFLPSLYVYAFVENIQ